MVLSNAITVTHSGHKRSGLRKKKKPESVNVEIGLQSAIDGIRIWSRPHSTSGTGQTAKRTGTIDTTIGE